MRKLVAVLCLGSLMACSDEGPGLPDFPCNQLASADSAAAALAGQAFAPGIPLTLDSLHAEQGEYPYRTADFWYSGHSGDTLDIVVLAMSREIVQPRTSTACQWAGGATRALPSP